MLANATAFTAVDMAESEPELAHRVNAEAVEAMARAMHARDGWLVHYSTDYVFSGEGSAPWVETDAAGPRNVYGASKLAAEQAITAVGVKHLILRTSWVYGAHGNNFAKTILRLAREREVLRVVSDQHGAPTSAELIAEVTAQILAQPARMASGTYHLAAAGETSWHGFAQYLVAQAGLACVVEPIPTRDYPTPAARPANSRLDCRKLQSQFSLTLPDWKWHAERIIPTLMAGASHGNGS